MRRPALAGTLLVVLGLAVPAAGQGLTKRCLRVDRAVEAFYRTSMPPEQTVLLAEIAPVGAVAGLMQTARADFGPSGRASYVALGLSRHARVLKQLRDLPQPKTQEKLGRALGLLALGDATGTGTVSWALINGPVELRRSTAWALSRMEQVRPRRMLFEAMVDPDPEVRLIGAEIHVHRYSRRARKVLRELLTGPHSARAAAAMYNAQVGFRAEDLPRLPDHLRGPVLIRLNPPHRKRSPQKLRTRLASKDAFVRAGAFAGLAAAATPPAMLKRYARTALKSRGVLAEAQLRMSLALLGDAESIETLQALDRDSARAAADVLWAFSSARAPHHRLDAGHAAKIARGVESWMKRGFLEPFREAQMIRALQRAHVPVGVRLSRTRLSGGQGLGLAAALQILSADGRGADSDRILSALPRLGPAITVQALKAARALCAR